MVQNYTVKCPETGNEKCKSPATVAKRSPLCVPSGNLQTQKTHVVSKRLLYNWARMFVDPNRGGMDTGWFGVPQTYVCVFFRLCVKPITANCADD